MSDLPIIHVTGDTYTALFHVPHGQVPESKSNPNEAYVHALSAGVEYIYRAIGAVCRAGEGKVDALVKLTRALEREPPFQCEEKKMAFYEVKRVDEFTSSDGSQKLSLLRFANADSRSLCLPALGKQPVCGTDTRPEKLDVLVHWFGEMADKRQPRLKDKASGQAALVPTPCKVHVQIGLSLPLGVRYPKDNGITVTPEIIAKPHLARIVVVNIGEISEAHRMRRSHSYEATAVDLLRHLRGDGIDPAPPDRGILHNLSMRGEGAAPQSILAVRINNAAVFLYVCHWHKTERSPKDKSAGANSEQRSRIKKAGDFKEAGAWLLCHKDEAAPLSQPELGQMAGYTGFVSAHLASALAEWVQKSDADAMMKGFPEGKLIGCVRRSIGWQRKAYLVGCLQMLYRKIPRSKEWEPIPTAAQSNEELGYDHLFSEIVARLENEKKARGPTNSTLSATLAGRLSRFDELLKEEVLCVKVDIERAVAHRTQWFMARSVAAERTEDANQKVDEKRPSRAVQKFDDEFKNRAIAWLSSSAGMVELPGKAFPIPIVRIGKHRLIDRREIEDFLALHQALQVYADSPQEKVPLNIAVFGAPGAGKSFAVKQVVAHLNEVRKGEFQRDPQTFNLSQFKSLDDLPAALHLVRNACLSAEIPVVFFDEFDSTFGGQPFGWLKYFLAPMQDGEFYHAGQTYRLGRAIFVFAGGVNRSFEELNGRVRNPGFCEAKGPDFISRLKAHLNIQGIDRPDEEADQGRYILRRGILLRDIVCRKFGLDPDKDRTPLLHESVARALLGIRRFKHGVRSLEAIIKMCSARPGHPIGPSDLPSMDQLEMHVDASELLMLVEKM
jgi:hypothetical protein